MIKKQSFNAEAQACAERSRSRRKEKNLWLIFVLICALAVFVVPVFAGGWAVVEVDSLPENWQVGEAGRIEFTILQHGEKPVHTLYFDDRDPIPLTPMLTATLGETILEFEAVPAKQIGHWVVDVTLPEAGSWEWSITPEPLAGGTQLDPLIVEAAVTSRMGVSSVNLLPILLGLMFVGIAIVGFVWWRRRETAVVA